MCIGFDIHFRISLLAEIEDAYTIINKKKAVARVVTTTRDFWDKPFNENVKLKLCNLSAPTVSIVCCCNPGGKTIGWENK